MKGRDLNDGNYVLFKNKLHYVIGKKYIDKIYFEKPLIELANQLNIIDTGFVNIEEIRPVPLAEDRLLELGFERDKALEKLQNDNKKEYKFGERKTCEFVRICWHPVGLFTLSYRGVPLVKVKYVHKLQNVVYELIEKELTI